MPSAQMIQDGLYARKKISVQRFPGLAANHLGGGVPAGGQ